MKILVTLISLFLSAFLFAQNPYSLHYTIQNSPLPSNNIKRILADDLDHIWMTTDSGLVRYYKDEWEVFNISNSGIYSNDLNYFYIDNYNNLWFQVRRGYHDYIFQKFNGVNWIYTDTSNICIDERDIFAVDDNEGKWILQLRGFDLKYLYYLLEDSCKFFTNNDLGIDLYGSENILIDKNNRLWLTSLGLFPSGIAYYESNIWHSYAHSQLIRGLDIDYSNDIVWLLGLVSSDGYGVISFNYNNLNSHQIYSFNNMFINAFNDIKIDSSGTILYYLGWPGGGGYRWLYYFMPYNSTNEVLYTFLEIDLRNFDMDQFMNKYVASDNGLYIINEEGIIFERSIARNRNLGFDSTLVGNTTQKELTIYNPYSSALMIDSISFTSSAFYSIDFTPMSLPPMDSATITIAFQPDSSVQYLEGVNFYDNYAVHTINLKGKGYLIVGVQENELNSFSFDLFQNYPNPFNPVTTISYQIPERGFVTLKVYDILGNEVATLVNEEKPAGIYQVELDGLNLSSGIYFYRLRAGKFVESKKMVLMK